MTDRLKERLANHTVRIQDMNASWDEPCSLSREALDRVTQLEAEVERLTTRISGAMDVIENGYPKPQHRECEHGKMFYEDCIACYDAYLVAALHQGDRKP